METVRGNWLSDESSSSILIGSEAVTTIQSEASHVTSTVNKKKIQQGNSVCSELTSYSNIDVQYSC